jgi:glycosyltransferase involved in cell wall biosynthesis
VPLVWHKVDFSLDRVLTQPLAAAVDGVVSVSRAVAGALGPWRSRRLLGVVGPPVRLPADTTVEPCFDPPAIGTLGRLIPFKGHEHIIAAAAMLSEEFPTLRVVLAGDSSPDFPNHPAELRAMAERLGISDRVDFLGFRADVVEVLKRLTVFVSATYQDEAGFGFEGLSGAMLEAGWSGLPVVATDGGGSPEGIIDGVTGRLVAPADPAAMARGIAPYLRDREMAHRAGRAGAAFTREHFAPGVASARLFDALGRVA